MNDVHIGGSVGGNFSIGDNVTQSNMIVNAAEARQGLLANLASLREQVTADHPVALTRINDLEEEATAEEIDPKSGLKAFDRLKAALLGVAGVTEVLATIEDQVRSLFSS
ncbi:hypothetical protein LWC34_35440 [Kibdelosporangium philippinense]|uniref:Uncharacterized protein n=1 Tax=Kibdelosporangium philippinense TaxID=211113 RepID=A0ABS8ZKT9_9PSEU|nr:hypothetical protein [Kibdelosporangium philippinense]MCE7008079.1 hypothetical protein [Kibdelosporangium philippinense]